MYEQTGQASAPTACGWKEADWVNANFQLASELRDLHDRVNGLLIACSEVAADVRTLLDYLDHEYLAPEVVACVTRLRDACGESE